jgi:sugar phosphate isomerase/epimerase
MSSSGVEIGFVTNCLGQTTIDEALAAARETGLTCLEVGPSVQRDLPALKRAMTAGDVRLRSLIYARNFLIEDVALAAEYRREMRRLLDQAILLGVPQITTSTGMLPRHTLDENIRAALDFWAPFWEEGAAAGVRFALEFCPTSGNFALGPGTWRPLLEATRDFPNFGLNYDPSHLLWQMIDPYAPLVEFAPHIFSVHAKDTHIRRDVLAEHGTITPYRYEEEAPHGVVEARAPWWEFRIPGEGDLDWERFTGALAAAGYQGAIMIELEAHAYTGSRDRVLDGLKRSRVHLETALAASHTVRAASG